MKKVVILFSILVFLISSCRPTDSDIKKEVENKMSLNDKLDNIKLSVSNGIVTLSGSLEDEEDEKDKVTLENFILELKGVETVINNIKIKIQPKCNDDETISLLKKIIAKKAERDISEISTQGIRTLSRNKEFQSCDCGVKIIAKEKTLVYGSFFSYLKPIDEYIQYTVQYTDDGEQISVTVH
jgi:hypothetical protein